jgi:phosphate transport system protein
MEDRRSFMPREMLDQHLRRVESEVLLLGRMVVEALKRSVAILKAQDQEGARQVIAGDQAINEKRFEIEEQTLTLIATQQPMASDVRILAATLEVITELERIGDYAKGIGRITLLIGEEPFVKPLVDVPLMAEKAIGMLNQSLKAFVERDVDAARRIPQADDYIDQLYDQVWRELLAVMMSNPQTIDQASYLLWVAHNLERAADRVSNICERVIFTVTGEMQELAGGYEDA